MSSPSLPVQDPSGSSSPIPPATAEIGGVATFIAEMADGASASMVQAARGGPPPELLDQVADASVVAAQLRESGYQLRFFPGSHGERTRIELHDAAGNTVRALSIAEAAEMASSGPIE
jgi:hypothetical protein